MRSLRVGDHALLLLVDGPAEAVAARSLVLDLAAGSSAAAALAPPVDVVPAATTLLVDGLPDPDAVGRWRAVLAEQSLQAPAASGPVAGGGTVVLDVRYDGPDLDVVAAAWGCDPDAVITRHQNAEFAVAFCGFAPGFAYCTARPGLPVTPRRAEPRPRVPAGSVALAGPYCGVYPAAMPGGWQLIGTTSAELFDPERAPPALLNPGDSVRFRAVS